jgi:hypothetical protein
MITSGFWRIIFIRAYWWIYIEKSIIPFKTSFCYIEIERNVKKGTPVIKATGEETERKE